MKVWTFEITGGDPFDLTLPQHPACRHDGKKTLWHLCGSGKLKDSISSVIEQHGASVKVFCASISPEQDALRKGNQLQVATEAESLDFSQIEEWARHTVKTLRLCGFDAFVVGDSLRVRVEPETNLVPESLRLVDTLEDNGVKADLGSITAVYNPVDRESLIHLNLTISEGN